jgi:hypothetical protein
MLHWLEQDEIRSVYRDVRTLLRPGGFLVNGDFLPLRDSRSGVEGPGVGPEKRGASDRPREALRAFRSRWRSWWAELGRQPSLRGAFDERRARGLGPMPPRRTTGPRIPASLEFHEEALKDTGFRTTRVVWEERNFRVLVAQR